LEKRPPKPVGASSDDAAGFDDGIGRLIWMGELRWTARYAVLFTKAPNASA
jgi:hypothetical protein